jgi:porphobilinogen synthase
MMDGRVGAIRSALDEEGHTDTVICSYAVKYASAYYGPFRDAAGSTPAFGDRRSHQMDPANVREAIREALLDVGEGADLVMVKPAGPYLDVVRAVRDTVDVPVVAYQVSGEMAMIEAAAAQGWIERDRVIIESLTGIVRAGAGIVLTYFALDAARLIEETR